MIRKNLFIFVAVVVILLNIGYCTATKGRVGRQGDRARPLEDILRAERCSPAAIASEYRIEPWHPKTGSSVTGLTLVKPRVFEGTGNIRAGDILVLSDDRATKIQLDRAIPEKNAWDKDHYNWIWNGTQDVRLVQVVEDDQGKMVLHGTFQIIQLAH